YATGPSAAGVQTYSGALDTLGRSVDQGLEVFVVSSNLAKLRDIKERVGGLKQTFDQLVGINQKIDDALKPIIKVSDEVSATFENLLQKTIDDTLRAPDETGIKQVKIAGDLRNGMTNFRLVQPVARRSQHRRRHRTQRVETVQIADVVDFGNAPAGRPGSRQPATAIDRNSG
ncbi:methyl-accepting chemotaxis protein, partial [Pseudomonas syringae pv. actinidiae ICMP 19096]